MKLNRRSTLAGLGALAAGSGAVFGSGAFTQVQADRTVTIQTAADASSGVQIQSGGAGAGFADINDTGDAISINLGKEAVNTDATFQVGNVDTTNGETDTTATNVAFSITDSTGFTTDDGTSAAHDCLGVSVKITNGSGSLTITSAGDGADPGLAATDASTGGGSAGTDFSSVDNVATGSSGANFLLNASANADDVSSHASGELVLDTSGTTTNNDATVTIEAEFVPDITV